VRVPLPPVPTTLSFLDRINRSDPDGLGALMTVDHTLQVFDEEPLIGRDANVAAWRGYFAAFPEYVIYAHRIAVDGAVVAVQGWTTGSHLGLPDEDELELSLIWLATVVDGAVSRWQLIEDVDANRRRFGLTDA
jgi:ketosteroid isomerase-like protein